MEYLYLALLGLTAGSLAKFILPGKDNFGLIMTIIIGIGGSYLGAYVSQFIPFLGNPEFGSMSWQGVVSAIVGSILLLLLARMFFGRK